MLCDTNVLIMSWIIDSNTFEIKGRIAIGRKSSADFGLFPLDGIRPFYYNCIKCICFKYVSNFGNQNLINNG